MKESFEHKGVEWKIYQRALLPLVAPDLDVHIDRVEGRALLNQSGALLLRYTTHFDDPAFDRFWYVIKDGEAGMDELSSNTRRKVRKGLKNCTVALTNKEEIAEHGFEVYRKAFQRYENAAPPLSQEAYRANIQALDEEHWDLWKVSDKESGRMVAYCRNRDYGHCCDYTEIKFDPAYLRNYTSYALFQTMNEHYLNEKGYKFVNDGARSIAHQTNVQDFLIQKFKFRKAYCKLHVIHKPWLERLVQASYPFRKLFDKLPTAAAKRFSTLLTQEAILRSQKGS